MRDSAHEYSKISKVIYEERKSKEEILVDTKEIKKEIKYLMETLGKEKMSI